MREILFRGKRTDNGEWAEGYYAIQSNHACFANELRYQHYIFKDIFLDFNLGGLQEFEVIPETVGQYTGLTDKNGKKIFEGDIVNVFVKNRTYIIFNNRKGEVCFKDGVTFIKGISEHLSLYAFSNYCEVIGNIHDNPELLKGGDDK